MDKQSMYMGKKLSEMTKEELIKALENMGNLYQKLLQEKLDI